MFGRLNLFIRLICVICWSLCLIQWLWGRMPSTIWLGRHLTIRNQFRPKRKLLRLSLDLIRFSSNWLVSHLWLIKRGFRLFSGHQCLLNDHWLIKSHRLIDYSRLLRSLRLIIGRDSIGRLRQIVRLRLEYRNRFNLGDRLLVNKLQLRDTLLFFAHWAPWDLSWQILW